MQAAAPNCELHHGNCITAVLVDLEHTFQKGCISVNCDSTCITICDSTCINQNI